MEQLAHFVSKAFQPSAGEDSSESLVDLSQKRVDMERSSPKDGASPRRGPMDIATLLGTPPSPIIDPEDSASSAGSVPMVGSPKTEPEDSIKLRVFSDDDSKPGKGWVPRGPEIKINVQLCRLINLRASCL